MAAMRSTSCRRVRARGPHERDAGRPAANDDARSRSRHQRGARARTRRGGSRTSATTWRSRFQPRDRSRSPAARCPVLARVGGGAAGPRLPARSRRHPAKRRRQRRRDRRSGRSTATSSSRPAPCAPARTASSSTSTPATRRSTATTSSSTPSSCRRGRTRRFPVSTSRI